METPKPAARPGVDIAPLRRPTAPAAGTVHAVQLPISRPTPPSPRRAVTPAPTNMVPTPAAETTPHVPVRPAPADDGESTEPAPAVPVPTVSAKQKRPKSPSTAPIGVIVTTVIIMIALMAVAIEVYLQTKK